jgi:polysaccharide biosynthesis transport protein
MEFLYFLRNNFKNDNYNTTQKKGMELKDYLRILKRRFYIVLLSVAISVLLVVATEKKKPPIYRSGAEIIIKKPAYEVYYLPEHYLPKGYTLSYQTRFYFLTSPIFLNKVVEAIINNGIMKEEPQDILSLLNKGLSIEKKPETEIVKISFKHTDPQLTYQILTVYIDTLDKFLRNLNDATIISAKKYIEKELKKTKSKLYKTNVQLRKLFDQSLVFNLSKIESRETKELQQVSSQLKEVEQQKALIQDELNKLNNNLIPEDIKNLEPEISRKFDGVKSEYEQIDLKIKEALLTKTPEHPYIKSLQEQKKFIYEKYLQLQSEYLIAKEKLQNDAILNRKLYYVSKLQNLSALEESLRKKYDGLRKKIFSLLYSSFASNYDQIDTLRYQKKMFFLSQKIQNKLSELTQLKQSLTKSLEELSVKYKDLKLSANLYSKPIEIIEKPKKGVVIPSAATSYWVAYILAGLIIGFVLAYLLEFTTSKVRTQFDIKKYLNVPIFVSIPKLPPSQLQFDSSLLLEVFNTTATLVENWANKNNAKVISVASATIGEGKTFVAINLSMALSRGERKVLLIDMDLRNPNIYKQLALEKKKTDFSDIISQTTIKKDDLLNLLDKYDNTSLYLLTPKKATQQTSVILKSPNFKKMLEYLREEFEYIIMDSPPLNIVADGVLLASYADGILLVIASGAVEKADLYYSKFLINSIGAKLIGSILNKATYEIRPYYYYHRGYYYKYYARKEEKTTKEAI